MTSTRRKYATSSCLDGDVPAGRVVPLHLTLTILTCHQPEQINLGQNTNINESIIVAPRCAGPKPPTWFISLDRMPRGDDEVNDLHTALLVCPKGQLADGWGEVSEWPAERIAEGDWTPAIWRSSELAEAAAWFANYADLISINAAGRPAAARLFRAGSSRRSG